MIGQMRIFRHPPGIAALREDRGLVRIQRLQGDAELIGGLLWEIALSQDGHDLLLARGQVRPGLRAAREIIRAGRRRQRLRKLPQSGKIGSPGQQRHGQQRHARVRRGVQDRAIARAFQKIAGREEVPEPVAVVAVEHGRAGQCQGQDARPAGNAEVQGLVGLLELGQQVAAQLPHRVSGRGILDSRQRAALGLQHQVMKLDRVSAVAVPGKFPAQLGERMPHPRIFRREMQD